MSINFQIVAFLESASFKSFNCYPADVCGGSHGVGGA